MDKSFAKAVGGKLYPTLGQLVFPSGRSMGVINETRACCLIANGSGYSFVCSAGGVCKSQLGPRLRQRRVQEKRMLAASCGFSLSSPRPPGTKASSRDRGLPDEQDPAVPISLRGEQ